jgi:hypothetical protein
MAYFHRPHGSLCPRASVSLLPELLLKCRHGDANPRIGSALYDPRRDRRLGGAIRGWEGFVLSRVRKSEGHGAPRSC